jgi:hypothetical protein
MAGRKLRKSILDDIEKRGGAEFVYEHFASGKTMTQLADEYDCRRQYMSTSLNTVPEYVEVLNRSRVDAADALVDQGLEMVDALHGESTSAEIAATREKVQWRKFMAGSYNQARYGNRPQTNVTISVSDMHLDALRKVNSDIAAIESDDRQRDASAIDVNYEDITDD